MSAGPAAALSHRPAWRHAGAAAPLHLVAPARPGLDPEALLAPLERHPRLGRHALHRHRCDAAHSVAEAAATAAEQARRDGGVVVACGGDGTINAVARAVWPTGTPMAVLPQGTYNFFSRDLQGPDELDRAFDALLAALAGGHCRAQPVGMLNDQLFLVNASLGLYPRVLAERERANRRFGRHRWVAWLSGARALLQPTRGHQLALIARDAEGRLHVDNEARLATLFIGCNRVQLSELGLAPPPPSSRELTAVMFAPQPRPTMARMAWRALRGQLGTEPQVDTFAFTELEVHAGALETRRRIRVACDGEAQWLPFPLRITRALRPLWVVSPDPVAARPADPPLPAAVDARAP